MKNSIENQELSLNEPFVYSCGERASSSFYPNGLGVSANLYFSIKDGEVLPTNIEYTTETINDGMKIAIEVASNGYIIKANSKTVIAESVYDMKAKVEELTLTKEDFKFAYDPELHNFINITDSIALIYQDIAEKSAAA